MRHQEYYKKYQISDSPVRPWFLTSHARWNLLAVVIAVLIEPFMLYGRHRMHMPFSIAFYMRVVEISILIVCLFAVLLLLFSWRYFLVYTKGYGWVGTFEVQRKYSSHFFHYLELKQGQRHVVRVTRSIFDSLHVGDWVEIRRDALGKVESIVRSGSFSARLKRHLL